MSNELSNMTRKQLEEFAAQHSVDVSQCKRKSDVLEAISAALEASETYSHSDAVRDFLATDVAVALRYSAFDASVFKRDASKCSRCAQINDADVMFERRDASLRSSCLRCAVRRSSIRQLLEQFASVTRSESLAMYREFVNADTALARYIRSTYASDIRANDMRDTDSTSSDS